MTDMFPETKPPRAKPRVMAHVIDAGCSCETNIARFECKRCGWQSEWLPVASISDGKRGIPCPVCNQMSRANRDRASALAASEAAQRAAKAETERIRIEQEQRNEHDTTAPGAQSIPATPRRTGLHDTPQPARVGAVRARTGE